MKKQNKTKQNKNKTTNEKGMKEGAIKGSINSPAKSANEKAFNLFCLKRWKEQKEKMTLKFFLLSTPLT